MGSSASRLEPLDSRCDTDRCLTDTAARVPPVPRVYPTAFEARSNGADGPLLARGLSGLALAASCPHCFILGFRRPRARRPTHRQPGRDRSADESLPSPLRAALLDPPYAPRRAYGPQRSGSADGDISEAFECRQAVPSPCSGGSGTGSWSEHAYGEAVDLNPIENPYVGCGRTRKRASLPYLDRSHLRRGMVTPAVVQAFRSIGWGWGGDWTGSTQDYMHFSASGH